MRVDETTPKHPNAAGLGRVTADKAPPLALLCREELAHSLAERSGKRGSWQVWGPAVVGVDDQIRLILARRRRPGDAAGLHHEKLARVIEGNGVGALQVLDQAREGQR